MYLLCGKWANLDPCVYTDGSTGFSRLFLSYSGDGFVLAIYCLSFLVSYVTRNNVSEREVNRTCCLWPRKHATQNGFFRLEYYFTATGNGIELIIT